MVALVMQTNFRVLRWFERIRRNNRPPYRWYEVEHIGL